MLFLEGPELTGTSIMSIILLPYVENLDVEDFMRKEPWAFLPTSTVGATIA